MNISNEQSNRIELLRFPLIILIVLLHSVGTTINFSGGVVGVNDSAVWLKLTQFFISDGIANLAVPLFFMISGYLFVNKFKVANYKKLIITKCRSLLFPFLFWNMAIMILFYVLQTIPGIDVFFSNPKKIVSNFSTFGFFNALFGLTKSPFAYQFWFIRDLFVLFIISPLFFYLLKGRKTSVFFLVLFTVYFVLDSWFIYTPSITAIAFFYIGGYLVRFKKGLFSLDILGKFAVLPYLIILLIEFIYYPNIDESRLHNINILIGVFVLLYLTKVIYKFSLMKEFLTRYATYSFLSLPFMSLY